jgi:7-cyano-7-deazaguanine synthase
MAKVIVMASGGIESNTLIAKLTKEGAFVIGLFMDIGLETRDQQFHFAKQALSSEKGRLECIDITGLKSTFLEFVPPDQIAGEADKLCPDVEWLPIYTAIAAYYAESAGVSKVYIGFVKDQMTKRRAKFLKSIGPTFASYQEDVEAVAFETPYATYSKAEVIAEGRKLGVDYAKSWSCIYGGRLHCGLCDRCTERRAAFSGARMSDPTSYSQ